MKDDGAGYARVAWAWLFPVRVYHRPRRRPAGRAGLAGRPQVGLPAHPPRDHQERAEARQRGGRRRAAGHRGRGQASGALAGRGRGGQPCGDSAAAGRPAARLASRREDVRHRAGHALAGRAPVSDQAAALAAHRPRGTLAAWKDAIAVARDHLIVQVGAYAGLASPLLHPLGLDSFTVDFSGRSTRGKTITAMVALSCWADPSDRSEGMLTWQTASVIGIEKRLNLVSGLTVVVDETRLVKDPALVDAVLYMIPKNHGRPRGGGWPNMIPWRAVVVSTGEQAATSFTSHQGASARVLSVQSPPFGTDGKASRGAAETVKEGVEANYGTAGPAFVARLQARLAEDGGTGKLRTRHQELTEMLRGSTDMTGRRAPLAACLALAAELAEEWDILPFAAPEVTAWSGMFASDEQRDNRPEMALDLVRQYLAAHADKMWGSNDGSHPPASGWIGHKAKEGPALLPEKLREELRRRGYELDAVIPGWLEMGALLTKDSQRPPYLIGRRTAGHLSRHLIFRDEIIDPPDPEDGQ